MNCKDIQELLPLYVGHDLPAKRASLVANHVQSCGQCAGVESEYRESRQLLQLLAPPVFSEGLYDGIRGRVLRQIENESSGARVPQLFSAALRPRLNWAFAAALLLAMFGVVFYFIAKRQEQRQLTINNSTSKGSTGTEQSGAGSHDPKLAAIPRLPDHIPAPPRERIIRNRGPRKTNSVLRQPQFPGTTVASDNRADSLPANSRDARAVATTGISANTQNPTVPETIPAVDSSSADKTMRVEMQTKDRNIRIIWFSHQPAKQDFPNKSSEGI